VDVAELCDAEAVKGAGQAAQSDFAPGDLDPVALNLSE